MKILATIILLLIFFSLAILHFYWAFGGEWGFKNALPADENGKILFIPRNIDSAIVGLGLIAFGSFYLLKSDLIQLALPMWIVKYGGWIIPILFLLRAVGEFKYVGLFKSISTTEFGRLDTIFYSPLCLIIGCLGIFLAVSK